MLLFRGNFRHRDRDGLIVKYKKYFFLVALIYLSIARGVDFPNELFGERLGSSVTELNGIKKTHAYQTIEFKPRKPDKRLEIYLASYDLDNKIIALHGYKRAMEPAECASVRDTLIEDASKKYGITFTKKTRASGSEYFYSESEMTAMVVECRKRGTRLRVALAYKRKR